MSAVLSSGSPSRKVQTTLRLPIRLYEQVNCFVEKNRADSINEFIVAAVAAYVKAMHRKIIDEAFVRMSEDADYQKEALLIAEQFFESDAEALKIGEEDLIGA